MSLGDQGLITYNLQWYESIGTAGIVKSYWVDGIDEDLAHGGCGFVMRPAPSVFDMKETIYTYHLTCELSTHPSMEPGSGFASDTVQTNLSEP